mmetsp:Transcript_72354/g.204483  ORF Transcript_72354/g.204483 Transcript_72354/m.204483 type:complete len:451 (+) Transcript_72354:77-1429(+)
MIDHDENGGQAWSNAIQGHQSRYVVIPGTHDSTRTEQPCRRRTWQIAAYVSIAAFLASLAYVGSLEKPGAGHSVRTPIASGTHSTDVGGSGRDVGIDAERLIEVSSLVMCKVRGGCECDCYWAYNRGACAADDDSCCFHCCCHKSDQHPVSSSPSDGDAVDSSNETGTTAATATTATTATTIATTTTTTATRVTTNSITTTLTSTSSAAPSTMVTSTTPTTALASTTSSSSSSSSSSSTRTVTATAVSSTERPAWDDRKEERCLCVVDVDRTLTGAQGETASCPGNLVVSGVADFAFSGGDLTLSEFGQAFGTTFCGECHVGIVSAGGVGGDDEKEEILKRLNDPRLLRTSWSIATSIESPLVVGCPDPQKSRCVKGIFDWYNRRGYGIPPHSVYFFDDHDNIFGDFARYGFNARQVACARRDPAIANLVGLCGARASEVKKDQGIYTCL